MNKKDKCFNMLELKSYLYRLIAFSILGRPVFYIGFMVKGRANPARTCRKQRIKVRKGESHVHADDSFEAVSEVALGRG